MNIVIRASHVTLSDGQRASAESALAPLGKLLPAGGGSDVLSVDVILTHEREDGMVFRIEGNLEAQGHLFAAKAEASTLEAALLALRSDLEREILHTHGRERRIGRRAAARTKAWLRGFGS